MTEQLEQLLKTLNRHKKKLAKQWASHNRLRNFSKKNKKENCKKNKKNGLKLLNFSVNFPKNKMIYSKKTLVNWYLNIPQVIYLKLYSNPTYSVKTKKIGKKS